MPSPEQDWQSQRVTLKSSRRRNILLVKPYQPSPTNMNSPPLGLLYLTSMLRSRFGEQVDVRVLDMRLLSMSPDGLRKVLEEFQPEIVGVSALNCEALVSHQVAETCKQVNPGIFTVIGGPYTLRQSDLVLGTSKFDCVVEGPAERTFPILVERRLNDQPLGEDLPGVSWADSGDRQICDGQDFFAELDKLPRPAWDLIDFDAYAKKPNFSAMLRGKRYATLFTSRGCPYLCNYCHDLFTKKFTYRSAEHVVDEIAWLYENHGVDEFQIVDDIFNLHKPRLKAIFGEIKRRFGKKLKFTYPNGLRADILDEEVIIAMTEAGSYHCAVAIETVTPRLQTLVEKHLKIDKLQNAITLLNKHGMCITGFFMLGFPTETEEEINATVDFALKSDLTLAYFFNVVPQAQTPLYDLAKAQDEAALIQCTKDEMEGGTYRSQLSWYQRATGYRLDRTVRRANIRFYFSPRRMWRILTRWPLKSLLISMKPFFAILVPRRAKESEVAHPLLMPEPDYRSSSHPN